MNYPETSINNTCKTDSSHLKILSIMYVVFAGLALLGIGFLFFHYYVMSSVFENPELWKNNPSGPPPAQLFVIFKVMYVVLGVLFIVVSLLNVMSAIFISQRKYRLFSLIIAGLDCLQIPFGTALGVFTFVILLRASVTDLYQSNRK